MAFCLQQIINAAPISALYALLAFGYSISFALTRRPDFTMGALFAFTGQIFIFFTGFGWTALWLTYPAALGFGATVALIYGLLAGGVIGWKITGPLQAHAPTSVIPVSLALMIVLMELVRIAADSRDLWLSPFLNHRSILWDGGGFPVSVTLIQVIEPTFTAVLLAAGALYLSNSAGGRAWRAVADDPFAAELMGINARNVVVVAGLATAVAASIAGLFASAYYGSMDFGSGLMFGLKVVMIAAIGEQTSPSRCATGAFLFGFAETFFGAYISFEWRDLAMMVLLVLLAVTLRRDSRS
ncbi:branched-chain amino acid ABC transporter permease [Rhizobium sp. G21]|uniref:branched-chain amino acid ABC transporter permease n=1 Tax=Rhizobium sp. G21 TaxID=2758439 RepID=UPI001600FCF6|nr:branched-chain amino acid ABC transporter permease [Rhizobium sp. G21]MBB1248109.1 branched-chain amino acid ABC transporter permease [Rhizobium sp. G21]